MCIFPFNTTLREVPPSRTVAAADGQQKGLFTSVDLVKRSIDGGAHLRLQAYFARIEEVNLQCPTLRAVIETNPSTLEMHIALTPSLHPTPYEHDRRLLSASRLGRPARRARRWQAAHGGRDPPQQDEPLRVGELWVNLRGNILSGFSGRGGQTSGLYVSLGDMCGSSSGSGVASEIGLARTRWARRRTGPSGPGPEHQDAIEPMALSVTDAAIIPSVTAARDPRDNARLTQPRIVPDYTAALDADGLRSKRVGVPRKGRLPRTPSPMFLACVNSVIVAAFNVSFEMMRGLGRLRRVHGGEQRDNRVEHRLEDLE
ncbi:hypothetical protein LXA43DRAFT_1060503 [Ganoderma leucocontextum]|nr:hypothetical protein LXA43DRAFT_1060503 [Ganoderma leucocontextum]